MNDLYSHILYIVTEKINTTYTVLSTKHKMHVQKQNVFPKPGRESFTAITLINLRNFSNLIPECYEMKAID